MARTDLLGGTPERLSPHSVEDIRQAARRQGVRPGGLPDGGDPSYAYQARHEPFRERDGTAPVRLSCDRLDIPARDGTVVRVLHATDLDELCTVAWSAFAGDSLDGGPVRDLMAAAVSRCLQGKGAACAVEWLSDNGLPFMSQGVVQMADRLDVTLVFRPARSSMAGSLSEAFARHVMRALEASDALRDSEAILAMLPHVLDGAGQVRAAATSRLLNALARPPVRKTVRKVRVVLRTPEHEA